MFENKFDVIILNQVIEHILKYEKYLSEKEHLSDISSKKDEELVKSADRIR